MINIIPNSILLEVGKFKIHWYGFIMVLAILIAIYFISKLAKKREYDTSQLENLYFYVILIGLVGARLYEVFFFNWGYYQSHVLDIFKVWNGGLAIQGTILFGIVTVYIFCKKNKLVFLKYTDLLVIGLALGQSIGRWGNFFNQELYGRVSSLPWAIYIERTANYHHPLFLYEAILNLFLFLILWKLFKRNHFNGLITLLYLGAYSGIRFVMEFMRIDPAPLVLGFRLPQLVSLVVIIFSLALIFKFYIKNRKR
jgi:phosphatidylglycerol---prolipoprotein diacylglyceryl transferase